MSDPQPQSDADRIRNKRLAKLGGNQPSSSPAPSAPAEAAVQPPAAPSAPSTPASEDNKEPALPSGVSTPNPFANSAVDTPVESGRSTPRITISSGATGGLQKREGEEMSRPRSRQRGDESLEVWQDRILSQIFRISLKNDGKTDPQGQPFYHAAALETDLESENAPLLLNISRLEEAIMEVAQNLPAQVIPFNWLLGCWKRVSRHYRHMRSSHQDGPRMEVITEARRLCMSWCIFAVTIPEDLGMRAAPSSPLVKCLLVDPDNESGLCHDFLQEAVARFPEDDSIREALVAAVEQLSRDLSKMSMNDNYKPYVLALRHIVLYRPLVEAIAQSRAFLPEDITAERIEKDTLLGPFFRLSPLQPDVAMQYFAGSRTRDRGYITNSQNSLRMTLASHHTDLNAIITAFIKASKGARERTLDWFALCVNLNHKRRAMQVDQATVSTDGFMFNVTVILDHLCEPFMDAQFSKIDRIDVNYLRRNPRVKIDDETKINADQATSDEYYAHKVEGESNFISEVFFLAVAAHHYGTEAANNKLGDLTRGLKRMERQIEELEQERHKYAANPAHLALFEQTLKKHRDRIDHGYSALHAIRGILLDEIVQARSMLFMRYMIVWLLKMVAPEAEFIKRQSLTLPLKDEQPEAFKCLPEYFLEYIVSNFKFITLEMPNIIMPTQCHELVMFCITFLRSTEYIKNPGLKAGLVSILCYGVWPQYTKPKGVLGEVLCGHDFAIKHLLHALMRFYIEAENTGTHTQFYDKFNIRYEIFKVIQCIWANPVYRSNLEKESILNGEFFVRFVNLLLNDVTYVLDEAFTRFNTIHDLQKELRDTTLKLDQEQKNEKEEALAAAQSMAKHYMNYTNETLPMLGLFTETLADSFTRPEIVQRLADMLDLNLQALAGPKAGNLKVERPEEYRFDPKTLLNMITAVYLNLGHKESFKLAVARDGRSYSISVFKQASQIMRRFALKSAEDIQRWEDLGAQIEKLKEEEEQEADDLGEIPDEYVDPISGDIMRDPVVLPLSKQIVDRFTIQQHLLSSEFDPFNRAPLKIEDVIPETELKEKINNWIQERKAAKRAERAEKALAADADTGDAMDTS